MHIRGIKIPLGSSPEHVPSSGLITVVAQQYDGQSQDQHQLDLMGVVR